MRIWQAVALLSLLASLLAHCGPRTVEIGALVPMSGEQSSYGRVIRQGIETAAAEINEGGGIQGKKIDILFRDTHGEKERGKAVARELVDIGVPVIIGAVVSRVTLSIAPIIDENGVILLSPASSSPTLSGISKYFFRNYPSDVLEGEFTAEYVRDMLGLKSIVILALDDVYSRGLTKVFATRFQDEGDRIVETIFYDRQTNFLELNERLSELSYDGIYLAGYPHDMAQVLKAISDRQDKRPVVSVGAFNSTVILQEAGEAAEGVIFPQPPFDPESSTEEVRRFVRRFRAMFDETPDVFAAHGYDALHLIARAIDRHGRYPDDIVLGLRSASGYRGVSGVTSFDGRGDVLKTPEMYEVKGGQFVLRQE